MANLEKVTWYFYMLQKIFGFAGGSGCLSFWAELNEEETWYIGFFALLAVPPQFLGQGQLNSNREPAI
jgi:hypothetical protein